MNKEAYESLISWAHEKPVRENMLCGLTKVLPIILGGMYIIAILLCAVVYPVLLVRLILRPFFCFLTVTVMRRILRLSSRKEEQLSKPTYGQCRDYSP